VPGEGDVTLVSAEVDNNVAEGGPETPEETKQVAPEPEEGEVKVENAEVDNIVADGGPETPEETKKAAPETEEGEVKLLSAEADSNVANRELKTPEETKEAGSVPEIGDVKMASAEHDDIVVDGEPETPEETRPLTAETNEKEEGEIEVAVVPTDHIQDDQTVPELAEKTGEIPADASGDRPAPEAAERNPPVVEAPMPQAEEARPESADIDDRQKPADSKSTGAAVRVRPRVTGGAPKTAKKDGLPAAYEAFQGIPEGTVFRLRSPAADRNDTDTEEEELPASSEAIPASDGSQPLSDAAAPGGSVGVPDDIEKLIGDVLSGHEDGASVPTPSQSGAAGHSSGGGSQRPGAVTDRSDTLKSDGPEQRPSKAVDSSHGQVGEEISATKRRLSVDFEGTSADSDGIASPDAGRVSPPAGRGSPGASRTFPGPGRASPVAGHLSPETAFAPAPACEIAHKPSPPDLGPIVEGTEEEDFPDEDEPSESPEDSAPKAIMEPRRRLPDGLTVREPRQGNSVRSPRRPVRRRPKPPASDYHRPLYREPEIDSPAILRLKSKALKPEPEPLTGVTEPQFADLLYACAYDRNEAAVSHKYQMGAKYNKAIAYVDRCYVRSQKQNLQTEERTAIKEARDSVKKQLDEFDEQSKVMEKALREDQQVQRDTLLLAQRKDMEQFEEHWKSEGKFRLYNRASNHLTTLRRQLAFLLVECKFEDAAHVQKLVDETRRAEEAESHFAMQKDCNDAVKILLARHAEEREFFEARKQVELEKLRRDRMVGRRFLENRARKIGARQEIADDTERLWNHHQLHRIAKASGMMSPPLTPCTKLTRTHLKDKDVAILTLPPVVVFPKRGRKTARALR
jgi:hypothetical protein